MMNIRRCLDILEIESLTSPEELRQAYRDLIQIWHPDRFQGNSKLEKKAGEKLREINIAYNHLLAYFDSGQTNEIKTSIPRVQEKPSRLGEICKTGIQNRGRPYFFSSAVGDTRWRQPCKFTGLKAYPVQKTRSAPKYIFFFLLIVILGGSAFLTHRIFNVDDIISKSTGTASDVLEKLIIKEMGKESIIKEEPSVRNIIQDKDLEMIPAQSKSCYEIYLDSGNVILTEFWWKKNDMIMYKKFGGSIGIECTRVKKIIKR